MEANINTKSSQTIELLAPAGNLENGKAAVNFGADAVYMGAPKFGARAAVGNSLEDIEELINYAHVYRAKVYATVNTILNVKEIEEAYTLIQQLYNMGIDGIIIQDMGLLEFDLPPVKLIASTQANNVTWEKVKFLEDTGFQRVILARELSLSEIKEIKKHTNIELEFFVHGALCVCYSGQCYMSYALGGRSGNRGVCAQPCRRIYSLVDSKGKVLKTNRHLMSLKDLNLSNYLEELIAAGITSFKIEGRLKDETYIKNIAAFYRQKIDAILEGKNLWKASVGKVFFDFTPDPAKTFNREYSDYFIKGRKKSISRMETPKSMGEPIGKVFEIGKEHVGIRNGKVLKPGDGICFFDRERKLKGTGVNKVNGDKVQVQDKRGIGKGALIYRNFEKEFLDKLKKSKTSRKIEIAFLLAENEQGVYLEVKDEEGITVSVPWVSSGEKAKNRERFQDVIKKNLLKLGSTEFYCKEVLIEAEDPDFSPVGQINSLRRETIDLLRKARKESYKRKFFQHEKTSVPYPEKKLDYRGNVLNNRAYGFYKRHGVSAIESAAEWGIDMQGKMLMKTRYCLKHELDMCPRFDKSMVRLDEPLFLMDEEGNRFGLSFDCASCNMEIRR